MNTLTFIPLVKRIKHAVLTRVPLFIWSSPGIGKSSAVRQACSELGWTCHDVRVSQKDPVELSGLPYRDKETNRTCQSIPSYLPTKEEPAILFMDELSSAPKSMQGTLYEPILDRCIGGCGYVMPDGVGVVGAGNLMTDRAVVERQSTALSNRFTHTQLVADMDDWCKWAILKNGKKDGDGNELLNIEPEVIAFLRFRPDLLHKFDPAKNTDLAFPSPRSWQMVSDLKRGEPDPAIEYDCYAGTIGEGPAGELTAFLKIYRNMPNIDGIFMNPTTAQVPTDPATLYAVATGMAYKANLNNSDALITYSDRLPDEFNVLTVNSAIQKCPEIQHTSKFNAEWITKHNDVVLN